MLHWIGLLEVIHSNRINTKFLNASSSEIFKPSQNKLGLNSIVVHGGGKKIKKKLDEQNIESKFIDGLRITDSKVIEIVEETLTELNSD